MKTQKAVLALLFCLLVSGTVSAQWKLINPLPTNNNLLDMAFLNALQGVAVGANGTILTTSNGGDSWKVIPTGSTTYLRSVATPDHSTVFICGDNGLLIKSDFAFSDIDTLESGTNGNLAKIRFLDANTGFCIGTDSLILKTTDAGRTWTPSYVPFPCDLIDLSFPSDSVGFLTGYYYVPFNAYCTTLFKTKNQGQSWQLVDTLIDRVNAICFTDSLNGFLTGHRIRKTTDGGKIWTTPTLPVSNIFGIQFSDSLNGLAINNEGRLIKTSDAGNTWTQTASNGSTDHFLCLSADTLLTYGKSGDIWISRNNGDQWLQTGTGNHNDLTVIDFIDDKKGYILGDSILYRTTDAGLTWKMERHPAGHIIDAAFTGPDRCLALSWSGIWLSTDAFRNWRKLNLALPRAYYCCAFASAQTAYITGVEYGHFFSYAVTYKSTDGGESWFLDSLPGKPVIRDMHFLQNGVGFGLGYTKGLYKTTNSGDSWEEITGTVDRFSYHKLFFPSPTCGYAIGRHTEQNAAEYNEICKTTDGGATWTSVYLGNIMFESRLSGLYFINETMGYVTGSSGQIVKTTDGGATWTTDYSTNWLSAINGIGSNMWAIGGYGTILTNNDLSAISGTGPIPESLTRESLITRISPNPFRDQTEFRLMISQPGTVRITLSDYTGRQMDSFTFDRPSGEFTWRYDGTRLPTGIYIVTATSGNRSGSARMIKISQQ